MTDTAMTDVAWLDHDSPLEPGPVFVCVGQLDGRELYELQDPAAADSSRESPTVAVPATGGTDTEPPAGSVPPALADVLAVEATRIELLGELVEMLIPPKPSQWYSYILACTRRARVQRVTELDADQLRTLVNGAISLANSRGQR
jgi:hypothetical protein